MNKFTSGGHFGYKTLFSKNTNKKNINILRKMYKESIRECKNNIKLNYNPHSISCLKDDIKTLKGLGYNNLDINYDCFSGNCVIKNMITKKYYVFYGKYFNELI